MSSVMLTLVFAAIVPSQEGFPGDSVALADYESCGVNSLYIMNRLLGVDTSVAAVRSLLGPATSDGSHSLEDLHRAAKAIGLNPICVQFAPDRSDLLPTPCIVQIANRDNHLGPSHFLVVLNADGKQVQLLDPPAPHFAIPRQRFQNHWNGFALIFVSNESTSAEVEAAGRTSNLAQGIPVAWTLGTMVFTVLILVLLIQGFLARHSIRMVRKTQWTRSGQTRSVSKFKSRLLVFCVGLACVCLALGFVCRWGRRAAMLEVEKGIIDLGEFDSGLQNAKVSIRNEGNDRLRISSIKSTCTCASVRYPEFVEPGQSVALELQIQVATGPQSARLDIYSNDLRGPKATVFTWRGVAPGSLQPRSIIASNASASTPYRRDLLLVYPGGLGVEPPKIVRTTTELENVRVINGGDRPIQIQQAGSFSQRAYSGAIKLHAEVDPPVLGEAAHVQTEVRLLCQTSTREFELVLPISVTFRASELDPTIGPVMFAARTSKELIGSSRVVSFANAPYMELTRGSEAPEWLSYSFDTTDNGIRFLRLQLLAAPPDCPARHTITFSDLRQSGANAHLEVFVCYAEQ